MVFILITCVTQGKKNIDKSKGIVPIIRKQIYATEKISIYASSKLVIFSTRKDASTKIPLVLSEFCQEQRQVRVSRQQLYEFVKNRFMTQGRENESY